MSESEQSELPYFPSLLPSNPGGTINYERGKPWTYVKKMLPIASSDVPSSEFGRKSTCYVARYDPGIDILWIGVYIKEWINGTQESGWFKFHELFKHGFASKPFHKREKQYRGENGEFDRAKMVDAWSKLEREMGGEWEVEIQ